ncbi:MFS general substrate transporter [Mycena venus]|uniref:MFS general substrate transporter n=1 Tax=Mycena venus TaxID=2733690 RepID=A0A8H7CPX5_9AGAR|nr:MFS general substrate transporter [Mycena venus]
MSVSDSADEKRHKNGGGEKHIQADVVEVSATNLDTGAELVWGQYGELDPAEALRVRKKIDRHILPLMCTLYWIQFMDKTTLGNSAILGITEATHLTTNQYNWLGTIFYLGYLAFQFPQNLALQRFPVAKWMSINIFVWAVALCFHAACRNFFGLLTVRFILGMCEGSITAGFMIVSSMFYTRPEQTLRVGYWFLMNGTAQIISGFISFGTLHIKVSRLEPWQWLMIITGILTLITAALFWRVLLPRLSHKCVVSGAPGTRSGRHAPEGLSVSLKLIKQVSRTSTLRRNSALLDSSLLVSVLIGADLGQDDRGAAGSQDMVIRPIFCVEQRAQQECPRAPFRLARTKLPSAFNSLNNQVQIIVSSFGFTNLQTTLLGCVPGVIEIATIWTGVAIAKRMNSRAWVAFAYLIPSLLGAILVNVLPWTDKVGLLFSVWLPVVGTTGFVLSLSWLSSVTAGHTKRITTNAIMLGAFCIGNSAGSFMWKEKYKPRNRVPWIVIATCYMCCMLLVLTIRYLLVAENRKRGVESKRDNQYDNVYVVRPVSTRSRRVERVKVDKEFLDLTDIQNRDFRYVY